MRKINVLILMTMMLALSLPVSATMIAYWDMADPGATDQALMPGNASRADLDGDGAMDIDDFRISSTDLTGNGNHLSAWTSAWMKWAATSFQGDFAMEATNGYPDSRTDSHWSFPTGTDAELIEPLKWTVECVFQATAASNRCVVGRIGQTIRTTDARTAAFYLAERSSARINCEFVDVTGAYFNATSANNALVAGKWYHAAAVSDGTTLRLYLKNLTDSGNYQVVATADLSGSSNPSLVADDYNPAAWSSNGGSWTVACSTWNGGTTDRFISPGRIDMAAISDEALAPGFFAYETGPISAWSAYDPDPQPLNGDGTVGTLNGSNQAELTLNFKAGKDPNAVTNDPVNPAILKHYVWVGTAPESLTLHGTVNQVHNPDPNLTDPANAYGPITLDNNSVYYWQVEEGLNKGGGVAYSAGDPNNIFGPVWTFKTVAAIPVILTQPRPTVADASGNASLSVTASATATSFQWYKVGTPDVQLSDGGIYSGTQTATLVITGATVADEGRYYCIAYNGTTPSVPSNAAWFWTQRLTGYWKLDGNMLDSVQDEVPGAPVHDGSMNSGDPNYLDEPNSIAGTAMSFYNDGQFMTVPDSDFFNFFRDGLTVSFWYRDLGTDGWRVPFSKLDPGTAGWLFGKQDTGSNANFIVDVPYINLNTGAINVSDGQWHMLTATYDAASDSMKVFVNGDQRAAGTIDLSNAPLPTALVSIGGLGTDAINGAIDEVRMYDYPLTPTQIAEMYIGFRPGEYICVEVLEGFGIYDLNDDCRINLSDFALVATEWLECQRVPNEACAW